ncbi:MAG: solute carrier 26 family protein [Myxococcales bacterium FL481]|nr:MAG: solute carrier 26 family protein [Myxococcales bacterium FL481]
MTVRQALARAVPLLESLRDYDRKSARGDVVAGVTTAVMLIPQGMGYAMIAGLPPIYGLYSSLVPLFVYGLLGTSRQLAVGPVAMVSLLVAAAVQTVADPGTADFTAYAILLALTVGLVQLAMGLARLGFLVNFLSHPVISGFTSAAALIIGFSQLKHLLGFSIARSHHVHAIAYAALSRANETHLLTLSVGAIAAVVLVLLKRYAPAVPGALAVVATSTTAAWILRLDTRGLAIVGEIPSGLPPLTVSVPSIGVARELLSFAVAIALVGFMESIAVAKRYAREHDYDVDANRELVALGLANVTGSFAGSYPVTGGLSRTAVNAQTGARTGLAGIFTAVVIGLTLLFLTPLFEYLPMAVLAAIIVTAVAGLVDLDEVRHLWRVKRTDLAMLTLTFFATLTLGIEEGIGVGVGASLLFLVFKSTRPHVAVLGRLPGSTDYRNVTRFPEAELVPGILALRLDAQIYFGNVNFLKETLDRFERTLAVPLRAVVLDASGMNQIDASGEAAFREVLEGYRSRDVPLVFANVKGPVRDVFERSGFSAAVGASGFYLNVHEAMGAVAGDSTGARVGAIP